MNLTTTDPRYVTALSYVKVVIEENKRMNVLDEHQHAFVIQDKPWIREDRALVTQCVQKIVYGALEVAQLPRFAMPAEFIAAAICIFVHPCNWRVACEFFNGMSWADDLADGDEEVTPIRPGVLFKMLGIIDSGVRPLVDEAESGLRSRVAVRNTKDVAEELALKKAQEQAQADQLNETQDP